MNNETQTSRYSVGQKIASVFLSAAILTTGFVGLGTVTATQADAASTNSYGLADNIQDGTILHCFCWKYNDIKAMLPEIAEAGFTSIQTSPAQVGAGSGTWWWLYQPLGFYVGNNDLGTKDDLKALCTEAENYGIKVVVDVVANHLAGDHSNIQSDLKDRQYWHNESGGIDYSNRWQITHRDIGMADINSEDSYVQQVVKNYLLELKGLGVDGIRWDAAKHISLPSESCDFWPTVTEGTGLWSYGEILDDPVANNPTTAASLMKEYTNYISVTDSGYSANVRMAFRSGETTTSIGNFSERGVSKDKLVYWAESHDTYSNNNQDGNWDSSQFIDQNKIDRAYAVVAAQGNATSLYFSRPSEKNKDSIKSGVKGSTHFTSKEVAAVNHFHNAMVGQQDYYTTDSNCAVVCREKGAVIVAGSGGNKDVTVPNGGGTTAPGIYIDEITGNIWTVTATTISGHIGDTGIAVVYNPDDNPVTGRVYATPSTGTSFTDTLSVTLNAKDVTNAKYTTSEGASGSYTDGTTITVGASTAEGSSVTVTLSGTKSDGSPATATYTYKKTAPKQYPTLDGGGFVFDNSTKNWSTVNAYVYDDSGSSVVSNASWPGLKMTDCGNGYWKYELDSKFANSSSVKVIFNNGSEQIPTAQQPGLDMKASDKKLYEDGTWKDLPAVSSLKATLSVSPSSVQAGNPVTLTASATGGTSPYQYAFSVKHSTATGWTTIKSYNTTSTKTWKPAYTGTYQVCAKVKDSAGTEVNKFFTLTVKAGLTNNSTISSTSITKGSSITLRASATGGTSPYQYAFSVKHSTAKGWTTIKSYNTTATMTWKPAYTGTYQVCAKVKDSAGTEVKKFFTLTVKAGLTNNSTISSTSITKGSSITLRASATGGTSPYQYAFSVKHSTAKGWTTIKSYNTTSTKTWKPAYTGTYQVCAKVKDAKGTEVKKFFTITVKA